MNDPEFSSVVKIRAKDVVVGDYISCAIMSWPCEVRMIEFTKKNKVVLFSDNYRRNLMKSCPADMWLYKYVKNS